MTMAAAIIVAAGSGARAATSPDAAPKQYQKLAGVPVLRRALAPFLAAGIGDLCVVIRAGDEAEYAKAVAGLGAMPLIVHGGDTRQQSVLQGLRALRPGAPDKVLIHDAARPLASRDLVERTLAALDAADAALPVLPVRDTVKRTDGVHVTQTLARDGLMLAQTPQGFRFDAILAAHERAAALGLDHFTDDAAIAEWAGMKVALVDGESGNIKITTEQDLRDMDRRLRAGPAAGLDDIRTGQGFDVHAFGVQNSAGAVTLCGVAVPHERALTGHSDADVGLHALTDALLGALADGDIGSHFPPSDARWQGAASDIFLRHAAGLVAARGGVVAHADVTLICEEPKIGPHREAMRARIAEILAMDVARVSVKATTSERLGFVGRREGIAALAAATVRLPWLQED